MVEVPKVEYVDRVVHVRVEVPKVEYVDRVVEVPVVKGASMWSHGLAQPTNMPAEGRPPVSIPSTAGEASGTSAVGPPWDYVCIDPDGIGLRNERSHDRAHKDGNELSSGDMVQVVERTEDKHEPGATVWLRVQQDAAGGPAEWAYERRTHRRMSELRYEAVADEYRRPLMVSPRRSNVLDLRTSPHLWAASGGSHKETIVSQLASGSCDVVVAKQAIVLVHHPKRKDADVSVLFLLIRSKAGEYKEGWLPAASMEGDTSLVGYQMETSLDRWLTVTRAFGLRASPSLHVAEVERTHPGELHQVVATLSADGLAFYKLQSGLWLPSDTKGFELVQREVHNWIYVCDDKGGVAVYHYPTNEKKWKSGKDLPSRQRVVVDELVSFPHGGEFLRLCAPLTGWVSGKKMKRHSRQAPAPAYQDARPRHQALWQPPPGGGASAPGGYAPGYGAGHPAPWGGPGPPGGPPQGPLGPGAVSGSGGAGGAGYAGYAGWPAGGQALGGAWPLAGMGRPPPNGAGFGMPPAMHTAPGGPWRQ